MLLLNPKPLNLNPKPLKANLRPLSSQAWDIIVMLLLLYTTFSVPYMLSFGDNPNPDDAVTIRSQAKLLLANAKTVLEFRA